MDFLAGSTYSSFGPSSKHGRALTSDVVFAPFGVASRAMVPDGGRRRIVEVPRKALLGHLLRFSMGNFFTKICTPGGDPVADQDAPAGESTNLDQFVKNRETMSPEDAARNTWTGRRAAEFGFTEVSLPFPPEMVGKYMDVRVLFSRPSAGL